MSSIYRPLLLTLAICGVIILVISGQTWVTVNLTEADLPSLTYKFSGRELEPIISGLAVVPLAGVVGLIAARGFIQRIFGLAIASVGATITYLAFTLSSNQEKYVENLVATKVGRTGLSYDLTFNVLSKGLVMPGIGVTLVGLIFTIRNFDKAKKRGNYEVPTGVGTLTPWQSLDSGFDPTISISDSGSAGGSTSTSG